MATKQVFNPFTGNFDTVQKVDEFVKGPTSSTDNGIVRYDGTTGKLVQDSNIQVTDTDEITGVYGLEITNNIDAVNGVSFDLGDSTAVTGVNLAVGNSTGNEVNIATGTGANTVNIGGAATTTTFDGSVVLPGDAVASLEAVTKQQLDAAIQGVDVKAGAKAATTVAGGNITLSGEQTVDGVSLVTGDRCLVKDQTDPTENGIYIVDSGAWTRADDANTGLELEGAFVSIAQGTVNANTGWYQTSDSITLGVTNIVWVQFFGAGSFTADGQGIELSGSTFSLELDGGTLSKSVSGLKVASGGITNTEISGSAAIAYSKLNLALSIVDADISASAAIAYSKLSLASSIVNADISNSAAIAYSKLNLASSIVDADVSASAAITLSKLAALTADRLVVSNGSGVLSTSSVTATEAGYLSGVTSAIQTQLNGKLSAYTFSTISTNTSASSGTAYLVSTGTAAVTVTLPTAAANLRVLVKDKDGNAMNNVITVAGGGANVDGSTSISLSNAYEAVELLCDGTDWWRV